MAEVFSDEQFQVIMDQIIMPQRTMIEQQNKVIAGMQTSFERHEEHDRENQARSVRIITECEMIMKKNSELQKQIENMPRDMIRRVDEYAELKIKEMEDKISACREGEPDRIAVTVASLVKKKTPLELLGYAGAIVVLCATIFGGALMYLNSQKDIARLEKEIATVQEGRP